MAEECSTTNQFQSPIPAQLEPDTQFYLFVRSVKRRAQSLRAVLFLLGLNWPDRSDLNRPIRLVRDGDFARPLRASLISIGI